ncbi:MAG: hypothetical protein ACRDNF_15250, partial [Streptosporangiaceae bacterium]
PVACTLGPGDLPSRMTRWTTVATRAAGRRSPAEHGLLLTFDAAPGVADELRALTSLERECCPFVTWSVREEATQVLVEVTGDTPEAVIAVRVMFAALST